MPRTQINATADISEIKNVDIGTAVTVASLLHQRYKEFQFELKGKVTKCLDTWGTDSKKTFRINLRYAAEIRLTPIIALPAALLEKGTACWEGRSACISARSHSILELWLCRLSWCTDQNRSMVCSYCTQPIVAGVVPDAGVEKIARVLETVAEHGSKEHAFVPVIVSFCKHCGPHVPGECTASLFLLQSCLCLCPNNRW